MAYPTLAGCIMAVVFFWVAGKKYKPAARKMAGAWQEEWGARPASLRDFIKGAVERFEATGTPNHKRRYDRARATISKGLATIIELFVAGHADYAGPGTRAQAICSRSYWLSLQDAYAASAAFRAAVDAEVSNPPIYARRDGWRVLLARMKRAHPGIVRTKLDFRMTLDEGQMLDRRVAACAAILLIQADPHYLDRVIWIDEAKIRIGYPGSKPIYWYHDAYDSGAHMVVEVPSHWFSHHIDLHFYVAVNARLGLIDVQFTTGTTPPVQRHGERYMKLEPGDTYQVG